MFGLLAAFTPIAVCLVWCVLFATKRRTHAQQLHLAQLLCAMVGMIPASCLMSPSINYEVLAIHQCIGHPLLLWVFAFAILYIHAQNSAQSMKIWKMIFFLPGLILLAISVLTLVTVGIEDAAQILQHHNSGDAEYISGLSTTAYAFYFVNVILTSGFEAIMILIVIGYSLQAYLKSSNAGSYSLTNFFFKQGETTLSRAISFMTITATLLMIPNIAYIQYLIVKIPALYIVLSLLLAAAIHTLSYIEFVGHSTRLTMHNLTNLDIDRNEIQPMIEENQADYSERKKEERRLETDVAKQDQLSEKLRTAFDDQHVYKDPSLSLVGLAAQLGTNRSTLSAVINLTYGLTFRDLLSFYRIEAAKKYLLAHPDATQEVVASECGFHTAQALSHKFKEVVGISPRLWALSQKVQE